jgi:uncharacterized damage-inducible protein DinB
VRHNIWANLDLLAFCGRLSADQLAWTAQGTYGSIHETLQHVVRAESFYLRVLTGESPPQGGFGAGLLPVKELIEREQSNGERIERVLGSAFDADRVVARDQGETSTSGIIAAQFIHHGSDHRAHLGTILGAHGIQLPELDVWAYGVSIGEVTGSV